MRRFQNDKTTYGLHRPNDFRPAESVCPCGADGYGNARRYRRYCLTTGSKIWYDRAFPLYHMDAGQSNSSLAHSIKGITFCPASFLLSRPIRRYVCFFEENQKKYARNERNVYFSTFTMYLVNQTMPRLLMRTYIQMLSSVKCRLTFSALFS